VFPIERRNTGEQVKAFAESIAKFLVRAEPARFTAKIAKQSRGGKIFVDYLRNAETASAVAAYSPRARRRARLDAARLGRARLDRHPQCLYRQKPAGAPEEPESRSVGGLRQRAPDHYRRDAQGPSVVP
jgi:hypothetical protein